MPFFCKALAAGLVAADSAIWYRLRPRLPLLRAYLLIAILSGVLYIRSPGTAWAGWWSLVPALSELAAAIEAVWCCSILAGDRERRDVLRYLILVGMLLWTVALTGRPLAYPTMRTWEWYGRLLLHLQETGMLMAAAGYAWLKHGSAAGFYAKHGAILACYFAADAVAHATPPRLWYEASAQSCSRTWAALLCGGDSPLMERPQDLAEALS